MNLTEKQARLLHQSQEIIEAKQQGDTIYRRRRIPKWNPDGTEVKTIEQVSVLLGTDSVSAALYVVEGKNLPTDLVRAAEQHLAPYTASED